MVECCSDCLKEQQRCNTANPGLEQIDPLDRSRSLQTRHLWNERFNQRRNVTAQLLVFDLTAAKCADVSGNRLCGHGPHMFAHRASSAASHPSTPPRSPDSAAGVQLQPYSLHCFLNVARPLQPVRHVKLNNCGILIVFVSAASSVPLTWDRGRNVH